jgi:glycosyltransferase involved in cell wall biosynthesis
MDVSVILATYNRAANLQTTLETFARLVCPPHLTWELLVIDNKSHDNTCEVVEKFAKNANFSLRYLFEGQQGKSFALHSGIAAARGEVTAFTDDDVLLHPDWLANLSRTFKRFDCAAVAGRVVPLWNHTKPEWLQMDGQQAVVNFELGEEFAQIRVPPLGANCAFRKQVFAKYGLFRLDLGVNGSKHTVTCEDTEFGFRLLRAGEQIVYCPDAIVYHPVDPKRTTKKYFRDWYYYNGVSLTRTAGLPDFGVFYFGVPRWLYRELIANWVRWMCTFEKNHRFNRKLRAYQSVGNIVESRRLSRLKAGARPSRELQHQ